MIDRIGPYLGVAAFLALAVLAVLLFLQAREVRRLREWAGRAPERAVEAAEATSAAAEAKGEPREEKPGVVARAASGLAAWRAGLAERFGPRYQELDRRSPVDPRILLGVVIAGVVAAAVVTGGFGLGGGGSESSADAPATDKPRDLEVAVLNGSQEQGVAGVPGLAEDVLNQVVKPAGYRSGVVKNAPQSYEKSVVLFADGQDANGRALARKAGKELGSMKSRPMSSDVSTVVQNAPLALVIGVDDKAFDSTP